jgi:hypothetical protein
LLNYNLLRSYNREMLQFDQFSKKRNSLGAMSEKGGRKKGENIKDEWRPGHPFER